MRLVAAPDVWLFRLHPCRDVRTTTARPASQRNATTGAQRDCTIAAQLGTQRFGTSRERHDNDDVTRSLPRKGQTAGSAAIHFQCIHDQRMTVKIEIVAAEVIGPTKPCDTPTMMRVKTTPTGRIRCGSCGYTRTRLLSICGALLAAVFLGIQTTSVSTASPLGDPGPGQCTFLLSTPQVTRISGVSFASATVQPGPCTVHASPNFSSVCLSLRGEDSSAQCASKTGGDPAVVYHAYRPGATYTVTGQGCASTFAPPYTVCQNLGPSQVTL